MTVTFPKLILISQPATDIPNLFSIIFLFSEMHQFDFKNFWRKFQIKFSQKYAKFVVQIINPASEVKPISNIF